MVDEKEIHRMQKRGRLFVRALAILGLMVTVLVTIGVDGGFITKTSFLGSLLTFLYQGGIGLVGAWLGTRVNSAFTRGEPVSTDRRFVITCAISQAITIVLGVATGQV